MHAWAVIADVLIALAVVTIWYLVFLRHNRKKAQQLLRWIGSACGREGRAIHVRWVTGSRFHVRLRLPAEDFHDAHIKVQLLPREMPMNWLLSRLRRQQEALTFEADLTCPPNFNLEVHNYRWKRRQQNRAGLLDASLLVRTGLVVLTTRGDWQHDLTNMMGGLLASRDCNFERVQFRRESPHFSATLPLNSLDLSGDCSTQLFEALQELAAAASAAMF